MQKLLGGGAVQKSGNWQNLLEPAEEATAAARGLEEGADSESGSGGRRAGRFKCPCCCYRRD